MSRSPGGTTQEFKERLLVSVRISARNKKNFFVRLIVFEKVFIQNI